MTTTGRGFFETLPSALQSSGQAVQQGGHIAGIRIGLVSACEGNDRARVALIDMRALKQPGKLGRVGSIESDVGAAC